MIVDPACRRQIPVSLEAASLKLDVAIPLLLSTASVLIFEGANLWPDAKVLTYIAGAFIVIATVVLQVVRTIRADRLIETIDDEVNDLRIAMKDSISPVARLLAEMPNLSAGVMRSHVVRVADTAICDGVSLACPLSQGPRQRVRHERGRRPAAARIAKRRGQ